MLVGALIMDKEGTKNKAMAENDKDFEQKFCYNMDSCPSWYDDKCDGRDKECIFFYED